MHLSPFSPPGDPAHLALGCEEAWQASPGPAQLRLPGNRCGLPLPLPHLLLSPPPYDLPPSITSEHTDQAWESCALRGARAVLLPGGREAELLSPPATLTQVG